MYEAILKRSYLVIALNIYMKLLKPGTVLFLMLTAIFASGQEINNTSSFRTINGERYFRFHYENDFFTAADYYYSQGIQLEMVNPALKKITPLKVLLHLPSASYKYGLSVEHEAYTPSSIRHNEILDHDRPFAVTLSLKTFLISIDTLQRISASLTGGIIGPAAGGEWMQKSIHKWLHNIEPLGWQNQVRNDVILSYNIAYEKKLLSAGHYLLLNNYATINAGTLKNNVGIGAVLMLGSFDSPFSSSNARSYSHSNFQFHFYTQPLVSFIAYDATLQGGVFNHNEPYSIPANKISRLTFQNNFGLVVSIRKIYLEYFQSILSKEFTEGRYHRFGGVRIGIAF